MPWMKVRAASKLLGTPATSFYGRIARSEIKSQKDAAGKVLIWVTPPQIAGARQAKMIAEYQDDGEWLPSREAAGAMGISIGYLGRLARQGKIERKAADHPRHRGDRFQYRIPDGWMRKRNGKTPKIPKTPKTIEPETNGAEKQVDEVMVCLRRARKAARGAGMTATYMRVTEVIADMIEEKA